MPTLTRQTTLLSIYGVFTFPFACIPFLFFYFADRGISIGEYLQMIAWYYWAMVILEIPTGMLADRCGRKLAMSAGSAVLAAGFLILHQGETFAMFCAGQVALGLGHALLSGAPTALLFDTLANHGESGRFLQTESRIHAFRLFGTGGSFLAGGFLAFTIGIPATILLTAALCSVGALIALFLWEAPTAPRPGDRPTGRLAILRASGRDLASPQLLWILGYYVILFGLLRYAFHTYQPFFKEAAFDPTNPALSYLSLGILFAALNLVAAPASRLVPWLTRRYGYRGLFSWLATVFCLALLAMSQIGGWPGVMFFFLQQIPFGMHWALIQDYVNHRLDAHARATTLSVLSFVGRISFALWLPLVGIYQEAHGTAPTYGLLGILGLALTLLWCGPGFRLSRR